MTRCLQVSQHHMTRCLRVSQHHTTRCLQVSQHHILGLHILVYHILSIKTNYFVAELLFVYKNAKNYFIKISFKFASKCQPEEMTGKTKLNAKPNVISESSSGSTGVTLM